MNLFSESVTDAASGLRIVAESVTQPGWPGIITAVGGVLVGLFGLWVKQRSDSKTLGQVKDQVTNNHETNLRDDVTEGITLMRLALDHVRLLPTAEDFRKMDGRLIRVTKSLDAERQARRRLEAEFRKHYPEGDGDAH